eukprot:m.307936 g.307936  ORF g.307936 m.307936 type:complete len:232 (+) comp43047_c0_seq1:63-758(+)
MATSEDMVDMSLDAIIKLRRKQKQKKAKQDGNDAQSKQTGPRTRGSTRQEGGRSTGASKSSGIGNVRQNTRQSKRASAKAARQSKFDQQRDMEESEETQQSGGRGRGRRRGRGKVGDRPGREIGQGNWEQPSGTRSRGRPKMNLTISISNPSAKSPAQLEQLRFQRQQKRLQRKLKRQPPASVDPTAMMGTRFEEPEQVPLRITVPLANPGYQAEYPDQAGVPLSSRFSQF